VRASILLALGIVTAAGVAQANNIDNVGVVPIDPIPVVDGGAVITEYTDYATWLAAVGAATENRYADLGVGVPVTNQYLGVGALYTDGDDVTMDLTGSSTDNVILDGFGLVSITLTAPQTAVGVNFPGAVRIVGYSGPDVVFTSRDFGGAGAFFFGGVISDTPFDRVEILDWIDTLVFPDDVFYHEGDPTPTIDSTWGQLKILF
jgi:hypothetical protein